MERIPYALGPDGSAVHISEVSHAGLACRCSCPHCGAALEAVNVENPAPLKAPHFRHYALTIGTDCAEQAAALGLTRLLSGLATLKVPAGAFRERPNGSAGTDGAAVATAVSHAKRIDSSTVRLHLAGGATVEIHLQRRTPRSPVDWAQTLAVLDMPISIAALLDYPPEQAMRVLSAAVGRWRTRPAEPAPAAAPPPLEARPTAGLGGAGGGDRLPPRAPAEVPPPRLGSWGYRWRPVDAEARSWQDAREIVQLCGGSPAAIDAAIRQLQSLQHSGMPVSVCLDQIAEDSGLSRDKVRDLAQHAKAIVVDS